MNYDIHVESSSSSQFRLSKPGSPSFSLSAEDSEDHRRWVEALENCKYVDIDSEMPQRSSGHGNNLIEDPAYEEPRDVIDKMKKNETVSFFHILSVGQFMTENIFLYACIVLNIDS